jgi:hypothetical protein
LTDSLNALKYIREAKREKGDLVYAMERLL